MFKKFMLNVVVTTLSLTLFAQSAQAISPAGASNTATKTTNTSFDAAKLKTKLEQTLGINVVKVVDTPMPGIALMMTERGLFYSSHDGAFLIIEGKVLSVADGFAELSNLSLAQVRVDGIKDFENDMIEYKAADEKYVLTVFTDITCGYCRKMHNQMAEYNALGITIRYLAYPRSGVKDEVGNLTSGFKDMRSVWCSEDSAKAMTNAKSGQAIAFQACDAPIEAQLNFGRQIGVKGTPAIILSDGKMLPGYVKPTELEKILKGS